VWAGRARAGKPIQTKSSDTLRVFLSGSLTGFPLETCLNSIHTSSVISANIGTDLLNPHPARPDVLFPLEVVPALHESQAATPAKCGGKRHLYTVSEDGHFVGHDGFVVPRSFKESFERHPRYVHSRVRLLWPKVSGAECEDREIELLIFLMSLPEKSKFRALGYNGFPHGCKDRIQTFSPDHAYGASKPRFLNYVKMILTNHFTSLSVMASSNPIQRRSTLSLYSLDQNGTIIDEAYVYALIPRIFRHCSLYNVTGNRPTPYNDSPPFSLTFRLSPRTPLFFNCSFSARRRSSSALKSSSAMNSPF
jgi:hypothetical protein